MKIFCFDLPFFALSFKVRPPSYMYKSLLFILRKHFIARESTWLFDLWNALPENRRRQLLALLILSLFSAFGDIASLGALLPFLKFVSDPLTGIKVLGPFGSPLLGLDNNQLLLILGFGFVLVVLLSTFLRVVTLNVQLRLSSLVTADLAERVFENILSKPFSWHIRNNSSNILALITKDVDQADIVVQSLLSMAVNILLVIVIGGSLIAISPALMLSLTIVLALLYSIIFWFIKSKLYVDGHTLTTNYEDSVKTVQESLGGIRDVLLDRTQRFFLASFCSSNRRFRIALSSIQIKSQVPRYLVECLVVLVAASISLYLAFSGQKISDLLPILGVFVLGAYKLLLPIQQCFNSLSNVQANKVSLKRLSPFLEPLPSDPLNIDAVRPWTMASKSEQVTQSCANRPFIHIKAMSYSYDSLPPWVLSDINLTIRRGERIGLVGSTGSGKSTLTDILLALLSPTSGSIFVNGYDLFNVLRFDESWRDNVAHVPQQIYLSDKSFRANIAYGVSPEYIDEDRVRESACQAKLAELIESFPDGYNAVVGENGINLSGGQRQRIGLARALYKNAHLLVLDEASSALDNHTESEIMSSIQSLNKSITVIIVAHRLSTVKFCDRIVVLDKGKIVDTGTFEELLLRSDHFKALALDWRNQNLYIPSP